MSKKIVLIGASGHGKVVADIAKKNGYLEIVFLDDNDSAFMCAGYPVVGKCSDAKKFADYDFFVSIGNAIVRESIQNKLKNLGLTVATLAHPCAIIADDVTLGSGTVVMAGAVVNPGTKIGNGCIINTCSSVDHDCEIQDYSHISVGAHVAGNVQVGSHTWIGAGATIINNITITSNCMIGAGAVVAKSIEQQGIYKGIPARISR